MVSTHWLFPFASWRGFFCSLLLFFLPCNWKENESHGSDIQFRYFSIGCLSIPYVTLYSNPSPWQSETWTILWILWRFSFDKSFVLCYRHHCRLQCMKAITSAKLTMDTFFCTPHLIKDASHIYLIAHTCTKHVVQKMHL